MLREGAGVVAGLRDQAIPGERPAARYARRGDALLRSEGVETKEIKLFLQRRGFVEERRRRGPANERFYQYCFPGADGKGPAAWVRLD